MHSADESGFDVVADWAASGAFALTGAADGPPVLPAGTGASTVRAHLDGLGLRIPGLLGERAAYAGLGRRGPWSCGGAFRVLATGDGHIGLSLSRPSDLELLPALVEDEVTDPWNAVAAWARGSTTLAASERIRLLGLPGGAVPDPSAAERPGVQTTPLGYRRVAERPLVIDLTSLWAGPLCAHLLGLGGARVIKVESVGRPDGARLGSPAFFDLLHGGHEQVRLDFATELDELRRLIASADLVLEASRPRALRQLGLIAEDAVAAGTSWLSITAHGRASDAVGFGDDVAARAGLVVDDAELGLIPVADALADPLTGVAAAVAGSAALRSEQARLIDVSMLHVAAETAAVRPEHAVVRRGDAWWVEYAEGAVPVLAPRRRGTR